MVFIAFCFVVFVTAVAVAFVDAAVAFVDAAVAFVDVDVDVEPSLDAWSVDVLDALDDLLILGPEGLAAVDEVLAAVDLEVVSFEDSVAVPDDVVFADVNLEVGSFEGSVAVPDEVFAVVNLEVGSFEGSVAVTVDVVFADVNVPVDLEVVGS